MHANLVISRVCIEEGKQLLSYGGVDEEVNSRQRVFVLKARLVELDKVDAKTPFPIDFGHHCHI